MRRQLMRRQQHVVGIAEQREHERKCPWQGRSESSQVVHCYDHHRSPRTASFSLDQWEERKLRAGCGWWRGLGLTWRHYTVAHYTVEHVVVCSDWRDLVPNLLNITSIRFGQVSYRPDCSALHTSKLQTTLHCILLYTIQNYSLNYSVMSSSLIFVITHILQPKLWRENLTFMSCYQNFPVRQ